MSEGVDAGKFPWVTGLALLLPGLVAIALGVALDPATPMGGGLLAVGVLYVFADSLFIQPRLEVRTEAQGSEIAAQRFLQKALGAKDIQEVAQEFEEAVATALGPTQALLIAPSADGGVRVLSGGRKEAQPTLGDATGAFLWLGHTVRPIHRSELASATEEGTQDALELMNKLGAEVILPLRHRGLLLGLALIGPPTKPNLTRLDSFYRAMRTYTTVAVANTFLEAEAKDRHQHVENLDLATAVQESLMPAERPVRRPGFSLRGIYRPVAECGGDLWAWRELDEDRILLVIADATGHGAAPSLLAAVAKGTIDAQWQLHRGELNPAELLSAMNRAIHRAGKRRYLMTAFAAVIDIGTGRCSFANAGQNFPYLIGSRGLEQLVARGNQLGIEAEQTFEIHGKNMEPGDRLFLYTDGFPEAGSPEKEEFGDKRFRAALVELSGIPAIRLPDQLAAKVEDYLQGTPLSDDMTGVIFELAPEEA